MTKEQWISHMETGGRVRPSLGGDKKTWMDEIAYHKIIGCQACHDRAKTKRRSANAKAKEDAYRSCGLTKVIGSVSGSVYWE
jgi:hypothetical protein